MATKILSWDVGIKNLAFCLLEINKDEGNFKILQWNVINLAGDQLVCQHRKGCEKYATFQVQLNNATKAYFCSAHSGSPDLCKNIDVRLASTSNKCSVCEKNSGSLVNIYNTVLCKRDLHNKLKKNGYICAHAKCTNIVVQCIDLSQDRAIGWCDEHMDDCAFYIKKKTKKLKNNCNKIPLSKLCCSMYKHLDEHPEFLQVTGIFIENQPTFINPTMKTISALLYGYFMLHGIHEKHKTNSKIEHVTLCSPSKKLKICPSDETLKNTEKTKIYKMTKKMGVTYTKALLTDDPMRLKEMLAHKKKDDMCDAFLQGFMMSFDTVPQHYAEKISACKQT